MWFTCKLYFSRNFGVLSQSSKVNIILIFTCRYLWFIITDIIFYVCLFLFVSCSIFSIIFYFFHRTNIAFIVFPLYYVCFLFLCFLTLSVLSPSFLSSLAKLFLVSANTSFSILNFLVIKISNAIKIIVI